MTRIREETMTRQAHLQLFLHGSVFLLISMIVGFPAFSLFSAHMQSVVHAFWRLYHIILISTGVWTIAVGAALPHLGFSEQAEKRLACLMIVSGYLLVFNIPIYGTAVLLNHLDTLQNVPTGSLRLPYYLLLGGNGLTAFFAASAVAIRAFAVIHHANQPPRGF